MSIDTSAVESSSSSAENSPNPKAELVTTVHNDGELGLLEEKPNMHRSMTKDIMNALRGAVSFPRVDASSSSSSTATNDAERENIKKVNPVPHLRVSPLLFADNNGQPGQFTTKLGQLLECTYRILEWMSKNEEHLRPLVDLVVRSVYELMHCQRVTLYFVDHVKRELWIALAKDVVRCCCCCCCLFAVSF